ncbi:sugar-binding transcriptional regulator [Homoserinibacter sp. GY 40078]|uniref:sugar-binding transcriptional regulator n=1 Tax=Homoserinibacter sp. GY 40078 TaxID=2603275 RepID=UPI0011CAF008|nr:sugar-binding transcriptional regulator [Homoserinibacter sp. GY 40078]TXK17328.1 sugar-binding transcriptional regulator [Homoserinibacter sp. GY 40078]
MDDELLSVRVAELYYDENKTQDEIGALLGISRWKAGRLLSQARENGIVRIEIVHPRARRLTAERELRERFGLADAVVVPNPENSDGVLGRVAQAAADYLTSLRPVPRMLGVSWGRTLTEVAERLPDGWATGVSVVQINGGVSLNRRPGTAATLASTIAQRGRGHVTLLPSPAILERLSTKQAIEADRTVAEVLARAASANAYLFSAGVGDEQSALVESGYLQAEEVQELARKGAIGDVVGRYIDANGNIVDPALDERTVGLGLERLREAATAIFVVAGETKHDIARAVVMSGLCTVLITDESTARALLEEI